MTAFKKNILPNKKFYIASFTNKMSAPYVLYIHGGPGINSSLIEYFIENEDYFKNLDCNLVLYDQRGCGRSANFFEATKKVLHSDNVDDLTEIYSYLTDSMNLKISGLIGHSYGAKVLYDFYQKTKSNIPGIFVSSADNILTPRLNNLKSDLNYLKKVDPHKYKEIVSSLDLSDLKVVWKLTEELAPFFQKNKQRPYLYWANLALYKQVQEIQSKLDAPLNQQVFMSVRKDLYSNIDNFSVNIDDVSAPHLWINGAHDSIMGEPQHSMTKKNRVTLFSKSAHYPHLEENKCFCEVVNEFTKKYR